MMFSNTTYVVGTKIQVIKTGVQCPLFPHRLHLTIFLIDHITGLRKLLLVETNWPPFE